MKPTKVPMMRSDQQYEDWKKELQVWEAQNSALGVGSNIQAGSLFQSLEGTPRQTVLSELSVGEITCDDGVKNIIQCLDCFYLGNATQHAFNVIDDMMNFKRKSDSKIENFIRDFQLKVNKVKATGAILSEEMLGYALLIAANLPSDKQDMVKATCQEFNFKTVKAQLEKIGLSTKIKNGNDKNVNTSNVKVEQCFCGNIVKNAGRHDFSDSSSDDDLQKESTFYMSRRNNFGSSANSIKNGSDERKFKINPTDRYGHVRECAYCKCHYHWILECPYAPNSMKDDVRRNKNKPYHKTL